MNETYIRNGERLVLGVDFPNYPRPLAEKGTTVLVIRIDGHGVLVRTGEGIPFYVQPEDLYPLGTVFADDEPLSPVQVVDRLDVRRFWVILITGVIVVALLFACFPQGL